MSGQREFARRLLDEVRAGIDHDPRAVMWALRVLGDA